MIFHLFVLFSLSRIAVPILHNPPLFRLSLTTWPRNLFHENEANSVSSGASP